MTGQNEPESVYPTGQIVFPQPTFLVQLLGFWLIFRAEHKQFWWFLSLRRSAGTEYSTEMYSPTSQFPTGTYFLQNSYADIRERTRERQANSTFSIFSFLTVKKKGFNLLHKREKARPSKVELQHETVVKRFNSTLKFGSNVVLLSVLFLLGPPKQRLHSGIITARLRPPNTVGWMTLNTRLGSTENEIFSKVVWGTVFDRTCQHLEWGYVM